MRSDEITIEKDESKGESQAITYKDREGNPIPDPKGKIHKINKPIVTAAEGVAQLNAKYPKWSKEEENRYNTLTIESLAQPTEKVDYQASDPSSGIGAVELWGVRNTQEDRISIGLLP